MIIYTFVFIILYFLYLYLNNNLFFWYKQAIGGSDDIYFSHSSTNGFDIIYKVFYMFARLGWHIFVPKTYLSIFISVAYILKSFLIKN